MSYIDSEMLGFLMGSLRVKAITFRQRRGEWAATASYVGGGIHVGRGPSFEDAVTVVVGLMVRRGLASLKGSDLERLKSMAEENSR